MQFVFNRNFLKKEIIIILIFKLVMLVLLKMVFFSSPISKKLDAQRIEQHYLAVKSSLS